MALGKAYPGGVGLVERFREIEREMVLGYVAETVVGVVANWLKPMQPFPGSEKISQESAEFLQPRSSAPDVKIKNLPHWEGVQDVAI
jgi:hypothetical protein